jgi:nitric oxide reductase NorE protein
MLAPTKQVNLPGDLAIWIFIYAELAVFGILFILFTVIKSNNPEVFADGHSHLNRLAGLINTIALITASFFVVKAVQAVKLEDNKTCVKWLLLSLAAASVYVGVKLFEYTQAISAGYELTTNKFYTYYYLLTIFHFAHVILGMVILVFVLLNAKAGLYSPTKLSGIESGASYWHMVDLVWVVLFPLLYVIH